MITVRVGPGDDDDNIRDFTVYETLIRKSSGFVDNALKAPWLESQHRVVILSETLPQIFDIYHQWLLTEKLHSKSSPDLLYWTSEIATFLPFEYIHELVVLIELSDLGHYLHDTSFTDTVNDAILQCTAELHEIGAPVPITFGSHMFEGIPEGAPVRLLVTELIAWTNSGEDIADLHRKESKNEHPDFIMELLQAVAKRFMSEIPATSPLEDWEKSCKYHSHGDEKPCYRNKAVEYVPDLIRVQILIKSQIAPTYKEAPSARRC
jgi:hypothetical protein